MAMVSSTAGAEPRPGSSRVSESSAGKLSSKMVSSLVPDSGWSSASHSDSSCPASSSVGAAPSSFASRSSGCTSISGSSCTSTFESSNAISASAIWSRLSRASAHASASWAASSWPIVSSFIYPPSSISGQHCTQKWSHIKRMRNIRSDLTRAHRSAASSRQQKAPGTRTNHIPGALQCVELRGAGYAASRSSDVCVRRVTRRARNQPWRGEQ